MYIATYLKHIQTSNTIQFFLFYILKHNTDKQP